MPAFSLKFQRGQNPEFFFRCLTSVFRKNGDDADGSPVRDLNVLNTDGIRAGRWFCSLVHDDLPDLIFKKCTCKKQPGELTSDKPFEEDRRWYYCWLNATPIRQKRELKDRADFELILQAYRFRGYDKGIGGSMCAFCICLSLYK